MARLNWWPGRESGRSGGSAESGHGLEQPALNRNRLCGSDLRRDDLVTSRRRSSPRLTSGRTVVSSEQRGRHPDTEAPGSSQDEPELRLERTDLGGNRHFSSLGFAVRLRNYFLTGVVVVGPVAITVYLVWWFIKLVDGWVKPLIPEVYNPETYLPFAIPGFGLLFAIGILMMIGALAANLLGQSMISMGEQFVGRMPIVRNVYRGLKQMFESMVAAAHPENQFAQVGLMEFPSKGIWSLVYVTGDAIGELQEVAPGGERDNVIVWMPTGFMPPTGFVCIVPRKDVMLLDMSVEDAAKIVMTAGLVMPDYQAGLDQLVKAARLEKPPRPKRGGPANDRSRVGPGAGGGRGPEKKVQP